MALLNMIFFLLICSELNMANCRALILYVGAGALQEALVALREAQQPDTAAMFILACREIYEEIIADLGDLDDKSNYLVKDKLRNFPVLDPENEDAIAVGECYGQYQRNWCICAWTLNHSLDWKDCARSYASHAFYSYKCFYSENWQISSGFIIKR